MSDREAITEAEVTCLLEDAAAISAVLHQDDRWRGVYEEYGPSLGGFPGFWYESSKYARVLHRRVCLDDDIPDDEWIEIIGAYVDDIYDLFTGSGDYPLEEESLEDVLNSILDDILGDYRDPEAIYFWRCSCDSLRVDPVACCETCGENESVTLGEAVYGTLIRVLDWFDDASYLDIREINDTIDQSPPIEELESIRQACINELLPDDVQAAVVETEDWYENAPIGHMDAAEKKVGRSFPIRYLQALYREMAQIH